MQKQMTSGQLLRHPSAGGRVSMEAKRKVPVYCAMSVHVKEPQVVEISGALNYGVPHSLSRFGTLNPINHKPNQTSAKVK